ncbi:hypothetical protein JCT86_10370 [Vibrio parahaemolyticus]|uniref:hypothetical protein n=1 Tax=Vibrio parahaemolyticus TaxID=670 RepID=UPI0019372D9C|nr:hypothetical protein [Vibrio parahaemolyticus]QQC97817.1 hypothetical protein JCT86_10370 [Vibrio parahaemolyticus]
MNKSDDITEKEAEIIKNSIIHIEAGDHLITDEAKRHKLALMVACAFVCMISLYPNAHVGSLFGIVKFTDESEISILKILPYALIVMIYQGVMYAYHLNEAKKAQINKKLKSIRKDNILLLNEIIETTNNFSKKIEDSSHRNYGFKSQGKKFIGIRESISGIQSVMQKIPNFHSNLTDLVLSSKSILEKMERQEDVPLQAIKDIHNKAAYLNINADYFKRISGLNEQLINITFEISNKCDELDGHFVEQYNHYLIRLFEINNEHQEFIKDLTKDKMETIDTLSKSEFSERNSIIIYTIIPTCFFMFSLGFSLFTYVKSF